MEIAPQSQTDTDVSHWENYWIDEAQDLPEHANPLAERQLMLLEMIASGDVHAVATQHPETYQAISGGNKPHATDEAAYELYLELGPDNAMGRGSGLELALAGRMLNGSLETDIVQQEAYNHDFYADVTHQTEQAIPKTTIELLTALQPKNTELSRKLTAIHPDKLLRIADVLDDASRHTEHRNLQNAVRNSTLMLLKNVLSRENLSAEQTLVANNIKYDLLFDREAEKDTSFEDYEPLMQEYILTTASAIRNAKNGPALEAFVPLVSRYTAWYDGMLNRTSVHHAPLRSDAPHDDRYGGNTTKGLQKRSFDIEVTNKGNNMSKHFQLKADGSDHTDEYNQSSVEVYDGGISSLIENLSPNQTLTDRIYETPAAFNFFTGTLIEACAEHIAKDLGSSAAQTSSQVLEREFGISSSAAVEYLQNEYSNRLLASTESTPVEAMAA